jgi:predicted lipid carrier protein YhbT
MSDSQMTGPAVLPPRLPPGLARAVAPLPLAPLQPLLALMLHRIGQLYPNLYERLGEHADKRFGIDPTDLPFAFVLEPRLREPRVRAVRALPARLDASIRGPLAGLVGMAEGTLDGDALFFSRILWVEGDVAAALALRNAIDDARIDFGTVMFGPLGKLLRRTLQGRSTATGARSWS